MRKATLIRISSSDQGTKGVFVFSDTGFCMCTMELPWRDNKPNISCIPEGTYNVVIRKSPRFGRVYWILNVASRSYILMHNGNFAGDVSKNWKSHSNGCLIVGKYFGKLNGQNAVLCSRPALRSFLKHAGYEPFQLEVRRMET